MADISVNWWPLPPYALIGSKTSQPDGIVVEILISLLSNCYDDFRVAWIMHQTVYTAADANGTEFHLPVTYHSDWTRVHGDRDLMFVPVIRSPGSVLFYSKAEAPVASVLLEVIFEGWPLLLLILLAAGFAGIAIWLLDRLWNPEEFPKPFVRGFWEGFWWAFITMTTVGYGDSTPRSIQARVFGIAWIIVGVTILSVFTATVTAVLTKESMEVAVLNGTMDVQVAYDKGATPIEIVRKLPVLDGAIVDHYVVAHSVDSELNEKIALVGDISSPAYHGILVRERNTTVRKCINDFVLRQNHWIFQKHIKWLNPFKSTRSISAAEKAQTFFQPGTVMYIYYGIGVWAITFMVLILWEIFYWRPKHEKRKMMKANCIQDVSEPGSSIKVKKATRKCRIQRRLHARKKASSEKTTQLNPAVDQESLPETKEKLKPGPRTNVSLEKSSIWCSIVHEGTYAYVNRGMEGLQVTSSDLDLSSESQFGVTEEERLTASHKEELNRLQQEFDKLKKKWRRRAVVMQRRHHLEKLNIRGGSKQLDEDTSSI